MTSHRDDRPESAVPVRDPMADPDAGATGRLLLGLTVAALLVTVLGIAVVWSLTYGPLG